MQFMQGQFFIQPTPIKKPGTASKGETAVPGDKNWSADRPVQGKTFKTLIKQADP
jgi:hypothetical protein